jgi:ubiquinone/menaquinone biosynthesis C-methylase UbiE
MERKKYMRDVYPKYWIDARKRIYGFMDYDKKLCDYICNQIPKGMILEVAIGTGYPIGDFLQKAGYTVHGIDISPELISICKETNSDIVCKVGDAESIDYPDDKFNCTYCFHSTWYFPNLKRAIDEMIRVTKPGGLVIFDIENRNNPSIDRVYRMKVSESYGPRRIVRYAKNMGKIVLRRGEPIWHPVVYEVPTYPEEIYEHLKSVNVRGFQVIVRKDGKDGVSLEERTELGRFEEFPRLVITIDK